MFGTISSWLKKRVDDVEGAFGRPNAAQTFRTNVSKAPPAQAVSRPRQATVAQPQVRNFTDDLNKVTQPKFNLNQSLQNNGVVPQQPKPVQVAPQPKTTQQLATETYGSGIKGALNKARDLFDANTEADQIKRRAQSGLRESYQQQQDRLTREAQNDPRKRGAVEQISGNTLGGFSEFSKAIPQAIKMQGAIGQTKAGKVLTYLNPVTAAPALGDELWKRATGQDTAKKRNELLYKAGSATEKHLDNKIQQSGLGNKQSDNRIIAGVSRAGGQLLAQTAAAAATGGSTIPSAAMGVQTASSEYDNARQAGKGNDQAVATGLAQGVVSGALEKVGFDKLGGGKSVLANVARGILSEGAQEGTQQLAQNLVAKGMYDPSRNVTEGVAESALIGGLTGGAAGPLMSDYKGSGGGLLDAVRGRTPLDQGGFVEVGRTPKNIHPEDQNVMSDFIDAQRGIYKPDPQTRQRLEVDAARIAERYGLQMPNTATKLANVFDRRLQQDRFSRPSLVEKAKSMITPLNEGGYVRLPGRPTELMVTHNLSAENLAKAQDLGGIPQASVGIVDPKKHAIDGYGEITLVGNEKLVDPKAPKTNTYASDVYSPRQPRATTQIDRTGAKKLQDRFAAESKEYGDGTLDVLGYSSPEDGLHAHPGVMASYLKKKGITPQKVTPPDPKRDEFELGRLIRTNELQKDYFNWLKEGNEYLKKNGVKEMENNADAKAAFLRSKGFDAPAPQSASQYEVRRLQRDSLRKQIEDGNLQNDYQQFINDAVSEAGATRKLYAGTTNTGSQRYIPETIDNVLKLMRKESQRGGEDMGGIGNMRSHITPKFKSLEDIYKNKDRLTDTQTMDAVKEVLESKLGNIQNKLEKYATNRSDNSFMEYDNQMSAIRDYLAGGKNREWFHQKFPNAPASVVKQLDNFKKELQDAPTEYFESVSDRAVKLSEFEKALIPEGLPKEQREALVERLNREGIQPRFYKEGKRQEALQQLVDEDNAQRGFTQNKPKNKLGLKPLNEKGFVQVPGGKGVDPLAALKQEANQPKTPRGNLQDALQPDTAYSDMLRGIEAQTQQPQVFDPELRKLERQRQQIIDAEARAKYEASRQLAQDQKDLRKTIRASGGIGSSDYETLPSSLKRKNGRALDDLAAELGFENDQALVDELTTHTQPERLKDLREVVEHEMKNGKSELSGDYKNLLKAIDDRHAELLRYPEGAKVVKNTQEFPSLDEFNSLLSTPEAQSNSNKTKQAVSAATADLRKQQFDAVVKGDLDTADKVRKKIGEIETGLKRTAPEVKREIETVQPVIKSIKDKAVREKFVAATKGYLGTKNSNKIERQVAIRNLENKYKLSEAEKLNAIQALDSSTVKPANDNVANYVKEFRSLTDSAYKQYRESGVNMGYQSSYLPRIYQNPETGQMYDSAEFELLQRGSKRMKGREADKVNTDWLVERDPTKLLERYYDSMDKVAAGQKYMKDLQNAGLITASTEPVPGLRPIVAEGMQNESGMTYYAPKQVADKLNTMFGSKETTNLVEKVMEKGSGINSLFQGFVLSGGIPNTPVNSFGMMQVMKEAMTLHPVKAGRAIHAGFSKKFADKYFTSRKDMIKLMAENDVDIRIDLSETGKSGWQRTKEAWSDSKAKGLNRGWDEITNDSTFKRFMPMLEVVHFENMYKKAYKKTGNQAEAARIAADSVKNFYGKTGEYKQAVRSKLTNDAMGASLFAPRFRESMVNFWGKNIKALNPKNMTKLEYRDNVKFMAASAFTFAAMNALNEALNGVNMWDNPDDKKDKLIIPADKVKDWTGLDTKGKDIGVPFLSSIATVPRNAIMGLDSLRNKDFEGFGKRAKTFLSMPLNTAGDILTNEDYFGNKIVGKDVKGNDRLTQMLAYTAGRNMQPWVREGLNKLGGNLPDDLKKRLGVKEKGGFETAANALESPLRFYDPRYYKYDETWTPRGGKNEKFTIQQQRERSKFKAEIDKIPDTLQLTNPQKQAFKTLNTYEFDNNGNLKLDNDPFYQAKRATALQDDGVFEAMKQKNIIENKLNGKPIDPIYELPADARRVILWKKTLPQGTSDPTIKQIYNQEWYQDYRGKEDQYFKSKLAYNKKMGYDGQKTPDTNPYPEAPPELQKKLDYYYTLPSGTGARSDFLRSNPDILAQWDRVENWKNGERALVGLGPIDSDNKYASGGKKSGGKGRKGGAKLAYKSTDTSSISKKLQQLAGVKSSGGGSVSAPKKHTPKLKGVRSV